MGFAPIVSVLQAEVRSLDPAGLSPVEAVAELEQLARAKKLVDAATVLLARRAADAPEWQRSGFRSEAEWLAFMFGTTVRDAKDRCETSGRIWEGQAPKTEEGLRDGDLSAEQAAATSAAAAADPGCEDELVGRAKRDSLRNTRDEADRRKAAAEDEAERATRLHARRGLFTNRDPDGAGTGWWRTTPEMQALLLALMKPFFEAEFDRARREGRREPLEAYRIDALLVMLQLAARAVGMVIPTPNAPATDQAPTEEAPADDAEPGEPEAEPESAAEPDGSPEERSDGEWEPSLSLAELREGLSASIDRARRAAQVQRWSNAKIIVRIDHAALVRRRTEAGEICEIVGVGPIPVSTVEAMLASGDPFVAAILTDGHAVMSVAHLGRHVNAYQQTALDWTDVTCVVEGCPCAPRDDDPVGEVVWSAFAN